MALCTLKYRAHDLRDERKKLDVNIRTYNEYRNHYYFIELLQNIIHIL